MTKILTIGAKLIAATLLLFSAIYSGQTSIPGPIGSQAFGWNFKVLANGNFIVTDPYYKEGSQNEVGAVYLYDGETLNVISVLKGSSAYSRLGTNVTILNNGNFVVSSPEWDNTSPQVSNAGAVTFCSGVSGCNGYVSSANSLVGAKPDDLIGNHGIYPLADGNYVVRSLGVDNGTERNVGAVTFCNGETGCFGVVSAANSLIGTKQDDFVGISGIFPLPDGSYVVSSSAWSNGDIRSVGAVTYCDKNIGCRGEINSSNSLTGSSQGDRVGDKEIILLSNGNYLVRSSFWRDATAGDFFGAVTLCSKTNGCTGIVGIHNSLVGSGPNEGITNVRTLPNGNYLVVSPFNSTMFQAGAVTFCDGTIGCSGTVSSENSLVGSKIYDVVGYHVIIMPNGNYIVVSPLWDNPLTRSADAGAITFCNGITGCKGFVTRENSLVGKSANDRIGTEFQSQSPSQHSEASIKILESGDYVVISQHWDKGEISDVGAVTYCSGEIGCQGMVDSSNSLVGTKTNDRVGNGGVTSLTNGNYVVSSRNWRRDALTNLNAGAATLCNSIKGCIGEVNEANSLVGSLPHMLIGWGGITPLTNGNYVVNNLNTVTFCNGNIGCSGKVSRSNSLLGAAAWGSIRESVIALPNGNYLVNNTLWSNGNVNAVGAVTFCDGVTGCTNMFVSTENSLVGSSANDQIGFNGVFVLPNGNYLVVSEQWDNGSFTNAGAITFCNGVEGCQNMVVGASNSLVGTANIDVVGYNFHPLKHILPNGNYVVHSNSWTQPAPLIEDVGAVTYGDSEKGVVGAITLNNSVIGTRRGIGYEFKFALNVVHNYLVVSNYNENRVTVISVPESISISGRVLSPKGKGIQNAKITVTKADGNSRTVYSRAFGVYNVSELVSGETVNLSVRSDQYQFEPKSVFVNGKMRNIDLIGQPLSTEKLKEP